MNQVTELLYEIEQGDAQAADRLLPLVYDELRRLASQMLGREKPGQTLQPTALVHEAYLRLVGNGGASDDHQPLWDGRGHFFAAAAVAMRRILVERARRKRRSKHGGNLRRVDLEEHDVPLEPMADEILALDESLSRLADEDPAAAQVVQLHFFGGLSIEQAAEALGVSRATAYREWDYARAWLRCAIRDGEVHA